MSKFKVGDKVKSLSPNFCTNQIGTIVNVDNAFLNVKFADGNTWYIAVENAVKVYANKIVITTDGKTTLARLYEGDKIVKKAEAKCSPDDEFNFNTGANLAYNKLMFGTDYHPSEVKIRPEEPQKPTYYSGKVVCVDDGQDAFAAGKPYNVVDGKIKDDDGDLRPMGGCVLASIKDLNECQYGKFIEFKGEYPCH